MPATQFLLVELSCTSSHGDTFPHQDNHLVSLVMPAVEVASRATNVTSLIVSDSSPTNPGQQPHVNDQFCSAPVLKKSVPLDPGVQVPSGSQLTRVVSCFSVVRAPSNNQGATRWWTHRTPARAWNPDLARLCLIIVGSMAENAQDWRFRGLSCSDYH